MSHVYMSVTVPDRPMVTIIGHNNGFTYYRCVSACVLTCVQVCVNFMKEAFSQSVSEPEFLLSIY